MLYHVKASQNFAKNKSKTKKLSLTWYIFIIVVNGLSYAKLY